MDGKQPSFRDFIHVGIPGPLGQALEGWVRKGYAGWLEHGGSHNGPVSWRFWTMGPSGSKLAWGLLRDSSDSMGRPHPLLLLASCNVRAWQNAWERLPPVLEESWRSMEQVATKRFRSADELQQDLRALASISGKAVSGPGKFSASSVMEADELKSAAGELKKQDGQVVKILLSAGAKGSVPDKLTSWHVFLKQRMGKRPTAVFAGGPADSPFLYFFYRPLLTGDFQDLWSVSLRENGGGYGHIHSR